jgi:uncharacterized protein (TIRG00374 family)
MTTRKKVATILAIVVSLIFIWIAFRNIDFRELVNTLRTVSWAWLVPYTVVTIVSFYWRAIRWQVLLAPLKRVSLHESYGPLMIGFGFNSIFPARAGEFARPLALMKQSSIPFGSGFSTVVLERICDALMLLGLFAVVPFFISFDVEFSKSYGNMTITPETLNTAARSTSVFVAILFVGSLLMISRRFRGFVQTVMEKIPFLPDVVRKKLISIFASFAEGFDSLRDWRALLVVALHTIGIWLLISWSFMLLSWGFPGVQLSFLEAVTFVVITAILVALPSVPGYWGLYEIGGMLALVLTGVVPNTAAGLSAALGFTLVAHFVQWIVPTAIGLYYAGRIHVSAGEAAAARERVETPA